MSFIKTKINHRTLKKGLTTARLVIRPLQLRDYEAWKSIYQNMQTAQNIWDESPWQDKYLVKAEYQKLLKQNLQTWNQDANYQFGIFLKNQDELVGLIRVSGIQRGIFQNGYLGYRIFNPYWGNQFGVEAVSSFSSWFLKHAGLHRLEAGISKDNRQSLQMIKKTNFKKEGLSQKRLWSDNQWKDHWIYALVAN